MIGIKSLTVVGHFVWQIEMTEVVIEIGRGIAVRPNVTGDPGRLRIFHVAMVFNLTLVSATTT